MYEVKIVKRNSHQRLHFISYVTMWCHEYNSEKSGYITDSTCPHGDMYFLFYRSKIFHTWAQGMSELLFFQLLKRNFVSSSSKARFYLLYKHWWNTKPFHFCCEMYNLHVLCNQGNGDLFTLRRWHVIFTCEDIIFSCKSSPVTYIS